MKKVHMAVRLPRPAQYAAYLTFAVAAVLSAYSSGLTLLLSDVQMTARQPPAGKVLAGLRTLRAAEAKGGPEPQAIPVNDPRWQALHARFAVEADSQEGLDLIFYGDSIVESWRGSSHGGACERCRGIPDTWGKHFGRPFQAKAFGIANDQTAHLLWRLKHGELPRSRPPKLIALLIGTNDLGAAHEAGGEQAVLEAVAGLVSRVDKILQLVKERCKGSQVLLLGLLPRGPTDPHSAYAWPSEYTAGIAAVNDRLEKLAEEHSMAHYIDCGELFIAANTSSGERRIDAALMPDATHPNAAGMDALGLCLDPTVAFLMQNPNPKLAISEEADESTPHVVKGRTRKGPRSAGLTSDMALPEMPGSDLSLLPGAELSTNEGDNPLEYVEPLEPELVREPGDETLDGLQVLDSSTAEHQGSGGGDSLEDTSEPQQQAPKHSEAAPAAEQAGLGEGTAGVNVDADALAVAADADTSLLGGGAAEAELMADVGNPGQGALHQAELPVGLPAAVPGVHQLGEGTVLHQAEPPAGVPAAAAQGDLLSIDGASLIVPQPQHELALEALLEQPAVHLQQQPQQLPLEPLDGNPAQQPQTPLQDPDIAALEIPPQMQPETLAETPTTPQTLPQTPDSSALQRHADTEQQHGAALQRQEVHQQSLMQQPQAEAVPLQQLPLEAAPAVGVQPGKELAVPAAVELDPVLPQLQQRPAGLVMSQEPAELVAAAAAASAVPEQHQQPPHDVQAVQLPAEAVLQQPDAAHLQAQAQPIASAQEQRQAGEQPQQQQTAPAAAVEPSFAHEAVPVAAATAGETLATTLDPERPDTPATDPTARQALPQTLPAQKQQQLLAAMNALPLPGAGQLPPELPIEANSLPQKQGRVDGQKLQLPNAALVQQQKALGSHQQQASPLQEAAQPLVWVVEELQADAEPQAQAAAQGQAQVVLPTGKDASTQQQASLAQALPAQPQVQQPMHQQHSLLPVQQEPLPLQQEGVYQQEVQQVELMSQQQSAAAARQAAAVVPPGQGQGHAGGQQMLQQLPQTVQQADHSVGGHDMLEPQPQALQQEQQRQVESAVVNIAGVSQQLVQEVPVPLFVGGLQKEQPLFRGGSLT